MSLEHFYKLKATKYGMPKKREHNILSLLQKVKGKNILDIGCSTGYFGQNLEKMGAKVTGIDISKIAIKKAKNVISNAIVVDLNQDKLPFNKKTFDIVIASEVIEHLIKPTHVLKEIERVLKSDGYFVVTTPNFMYWGNRLKFLKGQFRYTQSGMFDEGHVHFYSYQTLQEDLIQSGFNIIGYNHVFVGTEFLNFIRQKFLRMYLHYCISFFPFLFFVRGPTGLDM